MNYNYKNLSLGYTGKHTYKGTLNSQFYGLILKNKKNTFDEIMLFVQRVPKKDFFYELCELEIPDFKNQYEQHINSIINQYKTELISKKNIRRCINLANILLRHACFDELISYSSNETIEIALIKESAEFERALSLNHPLTIKNTLSLFESCINKATDREKILLLNRIIVNYYRHSNEPHYNKIVKNLCDQLLKVLEKYETNEFDTMLNCSVAYRGIALSNKYDEQTRHNFLNKAETLARSLRPQNDTQHIISQENLFNCLQSSAKWSISQKDYNKAESDLLELKLIDHNDSTGYSECGFFYLSNELYEKAAHHFEQALRLGPPGTGMNAYFYAKCLENLGRTNQAFYYIYQSTQLDKYAISPQLDLIEHYINQNNHRQAQKIANHLINDPILYEQLENEEKIYIKRLVN